MRPSHESAFGIGAFKATKPRNPLTLGVMDSTKVGEAICQTVLVPNERVRPCHGIVQVTVDGTFTVNGASLIPVTCTARLACDLELLGTADPRHPATNEHA